MRAVEVTFADGNKIVTDINGTTEEIVSYYLGNEFNFGDTTEHPTDNMQRGTTIRFLDEPTHVCKKCKHLIPTYPHECPDDEYHAAHASLMAGAHAAMDEFSEDELEDFMNGTNQHLYD